MITKIKKFILPISLVFSLALILFLFIWPNEVRWTSLSVVTINIGIVSFFATQSHWHIYQQAEYTREKMIRNLILDLLGLFLTMGAAMYAGGVAGRYLGLHTGYWIGLLTGFAVGFVAAWVVRSAWGKLVSTKV